MLIQEEVFRCTFTPCMILPASEYSVIRSVTEEMQNPFKNLVTVVFSRV